MKKRLQDKRTWELIVIALSTLGAMVEPRYWGMILWGGFVVTALIELLMPESYDTSFIVTFSEDTESSADTLG